MSLEHTIPSFNDKAGFFENLALRNLDLLRVHFRGKLSKKEGWRNVTEHCLVQLATAEVLGEALGLSQTEQMKLQKMAMLHDARKHMERCPGDFSEGEREYFEQNWNNQGVDETLLHATGPEFLKEALNGNSTFLQRVQCYLDDLTMGSEIVPFTVRTAETQLRNPNPFPEMPGGEFWEKERQLCHGVQEELFERIRAQGIAISSPAHIPSFLRSQLEQKMKDQQQRPERDLPPLQIRTDTLLEERRGSQQKNEDRVFTQEDDRYVSAGAFDGATAFADIPYFRDLGRSPGGMAADIAADTMDSLSPSMKPGDAFVIINDALRSAAASVPVDETVKAELFSAVGAAVQLDKKGRMLRFASIGDCAICLLSPDGKITWLTVCVPGRFEETEVAAALQIHQEEGMSMTNALNHPAVQSVIAANRRLENESKGRGYGSLKGSSEEQIMMYMQEGMMAVAPGSKIFVLTDGMLPPALSFREQCKLAEGPLKQGGVHVLLALTREMQEMDPECLQHPRLKQFDDAGAVEIVVE